MGYYTEFVFGCKLREDTPEDVITIVARLCHGIGNFHDLRLPDHEFFRCDRWRFIACCSSYYFGGPNVSECTVDEHYNEHRISIRSNLKNYKEEIQKFVDWIKPYVDQGAGKRGLLGYAMYEGSSEPQMFYLYDEEG